MVGHGWEYVGVEPRFGGAAIFCTSLAALEHESLSTTGGGLLSDAKSIAAFFKVNKQQIT